VTLPPDLQQRLEGAAAPLRSLARGVSWVGTDNFHVTLKFLGDIEEQRAGEIGAALGAAVADRDAFDIALRGLGAFPTSTRARVIWAGVGPGASSLASLAEAVERSLAPLGFPREARGFSAHVTLGRVREPRRDALLAESLARAVNVELGATRVDRVVLMRSELSPRGARYSELAVLRLGRRP
jgi:RNA 2',3'-cyclic 3'-phosphodiesterase